MAQVLVRLTVGDQAEWKKTFEEAAAMRKKYGSKGVRVFATADNPNEILVLGRYKDLDQARKMFASQEFRDATQKGGVVGAPEVTYLTKLVKLDH